MVLSTAVFITRVSAAYSSNIAAHWTGTGVQLKVSTPAVPNASEDYASAVQKAKGGSEKSISSQTR